MFDEATGNEHQQGRGSGIKDFFFFLKFSHLSKEFKEQERKRTLFPLQW